MFWCGHGQTTKWPKLRITHNYFSHTLYCHMIDPLIRSTAASGADPTCGLGWRGCRTVLSSQHWSTVRLCSCAWEIFTVWISLCISGYSYTKCMVRLSQWNSALTTSECWLLWTTDLGKSNDLHRSCIFYMLDCTYTEPSFSSSWVKGLHFPAEEDPWAFSLLSSLCPRRLGCWLSHASWRSSHRSWWVDITFARASQGTVMPQW